MMHPPLLQFSQNPHRTVPLFQPLPGIHVSEAAVVQPAAGLAVIQHLLDPLRIEAPLAKLEGQFQATVFASRQQAQGRGLEFLPLVVMIFLF